MSTSGRLKGGGKVSNFNGFFNQYPYTNYHELNLDYILKQLKELEKSISDFLEDAEKYTDEVADNLKQIISDLNIKIDNNYSTTIKYIDEQDNILKNGIDDLKTELSRLLDNVNSLYIEANKYTDEAILNNNEYIIKEVSKGLEFIKVLNYFTGQYESVQDMFDFLAYLHTQDAISYEELVTLSVSYDEMATKNFDYTDLATKGKEILSNG